MREGPGELRVERMGFVTRVGGMSAALSRLMLDHEHMVSINLFFSFACERNAQEDSNAARRPITTVTHCHTLSELFRFFRHVLGFIHTRLEMLLHEMRISVYFTQIYIRIPYRDYNRHIIMVINIKIK